MQSWATYRVQLHAGFGFAAVGGIAEYLSALGVTHVYCSPYLAAAAGSTHGYDVVDPRRFNDELGGASAHAAMTGDLCARGLGQVLDIVPNHMATAAANELWWDVLENGPSSVYAGFFDIDWDSQVGTVGTKAAFRILVPFLADHYGRVLEAGDLHLARRGGCFEVHYHDHRLPVSPSTIHGLLGRAARHAGSAALAQLGEGFADLPAARLTDRVAVRERHDRKLALAGALDHLLGAEPALSKAVDVELCALGEDADRLDALLRRQNYRLTFWRTASEELDYRRFFNIEGLVGLRVEDPEVFDATHGLVLELVDDRTVSGLRVDHIDGLRDPAGYLDRLASRSHDTYTVVEKILAPGETLPASWPVAGSSGYDFLTRVNNLFVASANEAAMSKAYVDFTGEQATYPEVVYEAKQEVMGTQLVTEVERATALLAELCDDERRHRDHTRRDLRTALREVVARFGVYRTYVRPGGTASDTDREHVTAAVGAALRHAPTLDGELLRFIGELALGERGGACGTEFALRLAQLTAPVAAKGVEDTAFYRYHRLVSLNEVGGDPGIFGYGEAEFHAETAAAASQWGDTMLTLSTHDTKRSADVRARLNVLSEIPEQWSSAVERWAERNERHEHGWCDRNWQYLLYQTLVGAWPLSTERAVAFGIKAAREAGVHTSWTEQDADYEKGLEAFTRGVLADDGFVAELEHFLTCDSIVERGRRNSLAQVTLLLTCPGVPDLYQGDELWNLSLVDPDNRRPVDFDRRQGLLACMGGVPSGTAVADRPSGLVKLWLTHCLLAHRRDHLDLYASDPYEPLEVTDADNGGALAFRRGPLVVVVPRFIAGAHGNGDLDTAVAVPRGRWRDALTGITVDGGRRSLRVLLAGFPVAVLLKDRC